MRHSLLTLLMLLPVNAGCQAETAKNGTAAKESEDRLAANEAVTEVKETAAVGTGMTKIDPDPVATTRGSIVSKNNIKVNGEPACDFVIRYPEELTWNRETCEDITARFVSVDELRRAGQVGDLAEEAKIDLERSPDGRVFYIESKFTASIYPLNVAGVVYEVPLAD
jgi:hypothetical protein